MTGARLIECCNQGRFRLVGVQQGDGTERPPVRCPDGAWLWNLAAAQRRNDGPLGAAVGWWDDGNALTKHTHNLSGQVRGDAESQVRATAALCSVAGSAKWRRWRAARDQQA